MVNHAQRQQVLVAWLAKQFAELPVLHEIACGASLRRYFRVQKDNQSYVVMDAQDLSACQAFVEITRMFQSLDLQVPTVYAADLKQGFLLLSDLGDQLLENVLHASTVDTLYPLALDDLLKIQTYPRTANYQLPVFDPVFYIGRMQGFYEWYLRAFLKMSITSLEQQTLDAAFQLLMTVAMQQPQVCVHYDYHCRNLLLLEHNKIGILDFQDAKWGPITYDLMSLLRDCYIDWPLPKVEQLIAYYHRRAVAQGLLPEDNFTEFLRWCDFAGLQAHFKNMGIFAKLSVQEGWDKYLAYMPRVLNYMRHVCSRYPELHAVNKILERLPHD